VLGWSFPIVLGITFSLFSSSFAFFRTGDLGGNTRNFLSSPLLYQTKGFSPRYSEVPTVESYFYHLRAAPPPQDFLPPHYIWFCSSHPLFEGPLFLYVLALLPGPVSFLGYPHCVGGGTYMKPFSFRNLFLPLTHPTPFPMDIHVPTLRHFSSDSGPTVSTCFVNLFGGCHCPVFCLFSPHGLRNETPPPLLPGSRVLSSAAFSVFLMIGIGFCPLFFATYYRELQPLFSIGRKFPPLALMSRIPPHSRFTNLSPPSSIFFFLALRSTSV